MCEQVGTKSHELLSEAMLRWHDHTQPLLDDPQLSTKSRCARLAEGLHGCKTSSEATSGVEIVIESGRPRLLWLPRAQCYLGNGEYDIERAEKIIARVVEQSFQMMVPRHVGLNARGAHLVT